MREFLIIFWLVGVIACGTMAWVTRKKQIQTYGDLVIAIFATLCPFVNILSGVSLLIHLLIHSGFLRKRIEWE